jgi:hypothetical protein
MANNMGIEKEDVVDWLSKKGCVTWGGRGWDVTDPKETTTAADWFISEIDSLFKHIGS